jgi:hypothetical protein
MSKKTKIKINKIDITQNLFTITSHKNDIYTAPIIRGSVDFKIYNENGKEVHLGNLEENDMITVYFNNSNINSIIKIKIKNKYVFNSDSSDESYDFIF